jgi:hypothetical protein
MIFRYSFSQSIIDSGRSKCRPQVTRAKSSQKVYNFPIDKSELLWYNILTKKERNEEFKNALM